MPQSDFDTLLQTMEFWGYIGGMTVGFLTGIVPMAVALLKKRSGMAGVSLVTCVVAGLIGGLAVSIPVSVVLILCNYSGAQ